MDKVGQSRKIAMLIGQIPGKISSKYQVAFPKKFREILGDSLIITQGFENSLLIVSESGWKAVAGDVQSTRVTNSSGRETKRFLLGGATGVKLDEKGRFILPEYLRKYALLEDEIIFLGQDSYIEIWDRKRWEQYNEELGKNISVIAEKLTVMLSDGKKYNE